MTNRIYSTFAMALALAFPVAALADVTGTPTVSSGSDFNFDNGTGGSSGGDIKFTGTSITYVGSATGMSFGSGGMATYSALSDSTISSLGLLPGELNATAIKGSDLAAGEVFVVHTNGGNWAKVLVTSVSSSSLVLQYDAFGSSVSGGTATPGITAVLDAGSYTSTIAQGSVFVVKGTNLSPAGYTTTSFPLPPSSGGVSISIAPLFGDSATNAYIIYLYNQGGVNQLAAILPSSVAPGSYNLTVTNGGSTSGAFSITVVASKPGLITQDSTGNGLVVAQNYVSASELDVNRYTTGTASGVAISPAHPGQTLILYLTGMGPVAGGDNGPSAGYDFTKNGVTVQVYVAGVPITPFYAGRTPGSAGLDQIDVTLPNNVATGCNEALQVSENGTLSQATFISIAPAGAATCVLTGFTASQLQAYDTGASTSSGGFSLQTTAETIPGEGSFTTYSGQGSFTTVTGFELAALSGANVTPPTNCIVTQVQPNQVSSVAIGFGTALDAGAITVSGPSASNLSSTALTETSNTYNLSIGEQGLPPLAAGGYGNGSLPPGNYTLKGAGGKDVGAFTASVTLGPQFVISGGLPTSVTRSSGLTLNWTGGNSSDTVAIFGGSQLGSILNQTGASFICFTTAGKGSYTVPASILNQLPAITAAQITNGAGSGSLGVSVGTSATSGNGLFNAPLTAGGTISNATFTGSTFIDASVAFQ